MGKVVPTREKRNEFGNHIVRCYEVPLLLQHTLHEGCYSEMSLILVFHEIAGPSRGIYKQIIFLWHGCLRMLLLNIRQVYQLNREHQ